MNILILEKNNYSLLALKTYRKLGKIFYFNKNFSDYDKINFLVIRLGFKIDKKFLKKFDNLISIISPTTGLSHIDIKFCKINNIKIISLNNIKNKIKKITSTSELTFGLILNLHRNIIAAHKEVVFNKKWHRRSDFISQQLSSLTLGIIGYGRIGKQVAKIGKAFGMKVIFYDKSRKVRGNSNFNKVNLSYLMKNSNIISIHINLNDDNIDFINESNLKICSKKPLIINTSRGEVVNEKDIVKFIKKNLIRGYGADVISNEYNKPLYKSKLLVEAKKRNNIILTPHIGGFTIDALHETENLLANWTINQYNKN